MVVGQAGTGVNYRCVTEWREQWLGGQETGILVFCSYTVCVHILIVLLPVVSF